MKTKIIASSLAGLALLGGTVAFAVTDAGATTPTTTAPAATAKPADAGKGAHWLRNHRHQIRRDALVASAKIVGVSPKDLRADLKGGQTLAQVANAKGISTPTLVTDLTKDVDAAIQKGVTAGKITQANATKVEAKVPAAVTKAVNHQFGQH
jgi:uncharacterized protein YidB (DUF937 family)